MKGQLAFRKLEIRIALLSSAGISILMIIPRIFNHVFFNLFDTLRDASLTYLFTILLWYCNFLFNAWEERRRREKSGHQSFPVLRLLFTSIIALAVMYPLSSLLRIRTDSELSRTEFLVYRGFVINLFMFIVVYSLNLFKRYRFTELENQELKTENLDAQLGQLRNQLNPHFLFNSLNTLKVMVKEANPKSMEFIIKTAELYRYLLQSQTTDLVSLKEELQVANAFVFILQQRFEQGLLVNIEIPAELLNKKIPPFAIQLLIENAIKHNIISNSKPLTISVYSSGNESISVANSLQRRRSMEASTKIGLKNLEKRYKLIGSRSIEIMEDEAKFSVKLPLF